MSRFSIILWDVDQTLLDFKKSQEYALDYGFKQFGRKIDDAVKTQYDEINHAYWKGYERGEITKNELLTGRFDTLFSQLGITDISVKDFREIYQEALGSVYYFRDDSYKLCSKWKGKVRQYAVTNGVSSTQRRKLHLSGLDQIFDGIFVSEEIGAPKPQLSYFEKCFQEIAGFQKDETLIVGDSLTSDMKGGNNAGIACCWYNPEKIENDTGLKIDYEIHNLWEVEEILCPNLPTRK
ncbi:MAG: YjjG family noncanonical pyrimidine nucleotidase [Lachnospiraceae bacterium]|nr:YjjG family noncanonical pyrimidine nucleotidase [Lachnospiraceae bacterium]MDE6185958.1 YjjG family noncanonical pyrimidine nucleotidase [Lachnospiraceae bacterium]